MGLGFQRFSMFVGDWEFQNKSDTLLSRIIRLLVSVSDFFFWCGWKSSFCLFPFVFISCSSLLRIRWSFSRVPSWNSGRILIKWGRIVTTVTQCGKAHLFLLIKTQNPSFYFVPHWKFRKTYLPSLLLYKQLHPLLFIHQVKVFLCAWRVVELSDDQSLVNFSGGIFGWASGEISGRASGGIFGRASGGFF